MTIVTNPPTVRASIPFFVSPPDGERAWIKINAVAELGERPSNYSRVPQEVVIENLRGKEDSVSLDTAGFQFYANRPPKHTSFENDEEIQREYYPESVDLIKELTGASRVVVFDHSTSILHIACSSLQLIPISHPSSSSWAIRRWSAEATTRRQRPCRPNSKGLCDPRSPSSSRRRCSGTPEAPLSDYKPLASHQSQSSRLAFGVM